MDQEALTVDVGVSATRGTAEADSGEHDCAVVGDSTDAELEDYFRDDALGASEISGILDGVGHIVDCLLRLSITIRNPAPHDHFRSRAGTDVINPYEQWDIKHVREKFPNADPGLSERLGKATARRRQYLKYREEHAMKLSEGLDAGDEGENATTVASSIPGRLKETQATADFAEFDDSESNVSKTSYAPSTADEAQLRVPPLPKEHAEGPFRCPYCCMIVSITTRHEWKKHVFRDLRPYVCLSSSCTTPEQQYLRRSDWMDHMRRDHWRIWRCHFGCADTFHSAREFEQHVRGAHPSWEPSRNLATLQRLSSNPDLSRSRGKCPLCFDFQIMSDKQYGSHVAAHLEQLALFALPSTGSGEEDDESRDVESESNGQVGKKYDTETLDSVGADSDDKAQDEPMDEQQAETEAAGSVPEGAPSPATPPAKQMPDPEVEALDAALDKHRKEVEAHEAQLAKHREEVEAHKAQLAKHQEDEMIRAEAQKGAELKGITLEEAEEALRRRLEEMRKAQEEAREKIEREAQKLAELKGITPSEAKEVLYRRSEEIVKAHEEARREMERERIDAETVRDLIEAEKKAEEWKQLEEEAMKQSEREARKKLAAEVKAAEERKKREAEAEAPAMPEEQATGTLPDGPIQQINAILAHFDTLRDRCEGFITHPPSTVREIDHEHRKLSETVLQEVLLRLDSVEVSREAGARLRRKEVVRQAQEILNRMDAVRRSKKKEGSDR
jgi:hypothetical protein